MKKILSSINLTKWQTWALLFLILLGTFLRTYHFHDWLLFGDDQIRDAYIAGDVVSGKSSLPLMGPFMSYSGDGEHSETNSFHLGPIYYYFQILSAKIFGSYPDKLAYPDLFFSILSIPLFYWLMSLYFGKNISLCLTAIYTVSSYFIEYSRFAMNTNLIPCFVILFLFALLKFLEKNEEVHWIWAVFLGFALGTGFQLHAITMVIFSIVTFAAFLVSMMKNYHAWKKWSVVALVFLILNVTQIIDGTKTNFQNTRILFKESSPITLSKFKNDTDCQLEANFFFLTSYGDSQCYYTFRNFPLNDWKGFFLKVWQGDPDSSVLFLGFLLSTTGLILLFYYGMKEKENIKKYFLWFTLIYFVTGFFIMLPLSKPAINDFRYLTFGFFIPFLFLGFFIKFLVEKISWWKIYILPSAFMLSALVFTNVESISSQLDITNQKNVTCSSLYKTNLGELEPVVQYITSSYNGQGQIHLGQNSSHRIMLDALTYLLNQQNIKPVKFEDKSYTVSGNDPVFYVSCKIPRVLPTNTISKANDNAGSYKKIGSIYVYQLNNPSASN